MSEYGGLVLPEHDLTPAEFKELARRIGRAAFVPLFLRFYERVITGEASIEEQRRALSDIGRWTGVEEEKKLDPNANLPVFNIVFGAPSASQAGSMQVLEVVQEIEPPPPVLDDETKAMLGAIISQPLKGEPHEAHQVQASPDRGEPPAHQPQVGDGHRGRERAGHHAGERPEPVQPAQAQAAAPPDLPHGVPQPSQTGEDFQEALNDLDKLLGL